MRKSDHDDDVDAGPVLGAPFRFVRDLWRSGYSGQRVVLFLLIVGGGLALNAVIATLGD